VLPVTKTEQLAQLCRSGELHFNAVAGHRQYFSKCSPVFGASLKFGELEFKLRKTPNKSCRLLRKHFNILRTTQLQLRRVLLFQSRCQRCEADSEHRAVAVAKVQHCLALRGKIGSMQHPCFRWNRSPPSSQETPAVAVPIQRLALGMVWDPEIDLELSSTTFTKLVRPCCDLVRLQ
jgi:hypothetical protein